MGPGALILLIICGIAFAGGGILLSKVVARTSKNAQKGQAYECGVPLKEVLGYSLMWVLPVRPDILDI